MSETGKAVFLSYASQDAEAARKICEALRAAGVEVWFDQSELVGGDAWDQKIRKQIKECALLLPIISASTQARREGYFRLEWRLAVERMRQMDDDLPFLLPVVIDGTKDAEAFVPDRFREVQWTRLPGGETSPAFCDRVKKLLGGETEDRGRRTEDGTENRRPKIENHARSAGARWWWLAFPFFGLSMAAILYFNPPRSSESKPPAATVAPAAALSKARELAYRARTLIENGDDANRETFATAEELLKSALELDPTDGEAVAIYAQLSRSFYRYGYDRSDARNDLARRLAERALMLAPNSLEAKFALAYDYYRSNSTESEKLLRELLAQHPHDKRLLRTLGVTLRIQGRREDAVAAWQKAADLPGSDAESLAEIARTLNSLGRQAEAEAALDRSLKLRASGHTLMFKMWLQLRYRGDLDAAQATLAQLPAWAPFEDRGAYQASQLWLWRREPDKAIAALERVPREQLYDNTYVGPKRLLTGQAHQLAGRSEAARNEWKRALQLTENTLKEERSASWLAWQAWLQAALGDRAAAEVSRRVFDETIPRLAAKAMLLANIDIQLGNYDSALSVLERFVNERDYLSANDTISAAALRLDPAWDPVRKDARFQAVVARVAKDEADLVQGSGGSRESALTETRPGGSSFAQASPVAKAMEDRSEDWSGKASPPDQKSVAVLAFANLSDDKANEYFSDGISEELLNVLAKVPGLKVSARTSSFYFKGKEVPLPEIAKQLGVAYVVEGSVRRQGERVRITAQLIKAADGFHVWSDTFTRDLKDIFAVQDEIAGLIAKNLELKLGDTARTVRPVNPEAHQLVLRARTEWRRRTAESFDRAEALLQQALSFDPEFAPAYATLAYVGLVRDDTAGNFDLQGNPTPQVETALAYANRALELDASSADAHVALAGVLALLRRWPEAEREFRQAIKLNPNHATAHQWLARLLEADGRMDEALGTIRRATELDPLSSRIFDNLAMILIHAGQNTAARDAIDRAVLLQPDNRQALVLKTEILLRLNRREEARPLAEDAVSRLLNSTSPIDTSNGHVCRVLAGIDDRARVVAAYERIPASVMAPKLIAAVPAGRTDEALASLQPALLTYWWTNELLWNDTLDPIRGTPRFQEMIRQAGLTESNQRVQAWRRAHVPAKPEAMK